jgi:hypothetical protein
MVFEEILGHLLKALFATMKIQCIQIVKLFVAAVVLTTAVSCVSTQTITIEIPQKSQKDLPDHIQSLTLVARTVDDRYTNLSKDSLQNIFYKKQFDMDTVIFDIQALDTTIKALGELLYESGRYDFVIPENRFLPFERNAFLSKEMPWNQVKELCELYNTDAILSLEHFKNRVITTFDTESFFDPGTQGFFSAPVAKMTVNYEALFRVYDPLEEKVVLTEFIRDTIFWEDADLSTRELFKKFTPVKKALSESGILIALDLSEKIGTSWRTEKRTFFSKGNAEIKSAGIFAKSGDFENATAIWKSIEASTNSKTIKSKAQLNIALAYEINGDLKNAVQWALKSYESMYRPATYEYLELLKRRNRELKKLQQ